jgi:hypothetical protein
MWIVFYHNFGKSFKICMFEHNNNINENTCMHAAKSPPPPGVSANLLTNLHLRHLKLFLLIFKINAFNFDHCIWYISLCSSIMIFSQKFGGSGGRRSLVFPHLPVPMSSHHVHMFQYEHQLALQY